MLEVPKSSIIPSREGQPFYSMASAYFENILIYFERAIEGTVIIDRDVTMDNQQPSPILNVYILKLDAVHRLRWQWVIRENCLRYSRADYHI